MAAIHGCAICEGKMGECDIRLLLWLWTVKDDAECMLSPTVKANTNINLRGLSIAQNSLGFQQKNTNKHSILYPRWSNQPLSLGESNSDDTKDGQ